MIFPALPAEGKAGEGKVVPSMRDAMLRSSRTIMPQAMYM